MGIETIKAGQWISKRGKPFSIYKLILGKISVHSGDNKICDVEIKEGMEPIMPGITAVLSDTHKHTASVKAETNIGVEKVSVDNISKIIQYEVTDSIRNEILVMTKTIAHGNAIMKHLNEFSSLSSVDLEVPGDLRACPQITCTFCISSSGHL